jgi:large subunit ribosomal protein L4
MNRKERRKALFCALSAKLANNQLVVVDKIELSEAKTKNMVAVCNKLPYEKNMLLALPSKDESIERTVANLPYVKTILADYLNIKDILKYNTVVVLKDSLEKVNTLAK